MENNLAASWEDVSRIPRGNDYLTTGFNNFDLKVPAGAIHGFIGKKGAGNITALHLLLGLLRPDSGKTKIFSHQKKALYAGEVGFCPENFNSFPAATVREVLDLFAGLKSSSFRDDGNYLRQLGLDELLEIKFANLAPHQKKSLGLAVALLNDPKLLLLIEPTEGLAPGAQDQLSSLLNRHNQKNRTTIIATSRVNLARRICTHSFQFQTSNNRIIVNKDD